MGLIIHLKRDKRKVQIPQQLNLRGKSAKHYETVMMERPWAGEPMVHS